MPSARRAALAVLVRFESEKESLRALLDMAPPDLAERDRAFCRELVNGVVQRINTLDWALNRFSRPPVEKLNPSLRNILRLGALQILYKGDRVPAYAAVSESVDLAKLHGHKGVASFVNGVLRSLERRKNALPWPDETAHPVQAFSLKHSHPEWLVRRWLDRLGPQECAALLTKNNEPPPFCVRVNVLKSTREDLRRALAQEGVAAEPSPVSPDGLRFNAWPSLHGLKSFQEGKFLVQDDSSQWVARVLDPKPGESVLDLCAGVGGKSTHIAERMDNQGRVTAVDTSADRLSLLTENSRRLGAAIIHPDLLDAREAGKKYFESADRVLVDAPCSGLGVVRRRPDLRWSKREADVRETLPRLQADLLRAAALCLKPGGVLVYSTCTLEPEEDEGVVRTFLAERADFQIEPPPAPGATPEGYVQLWPHRHDTDGFFIARLRKSAQGKILKGNL